MLLALANSIFLLINNLEIPSFLNNYKVHHLYQTKILYTAFRYNTFAHIE